MMKAFDWDGLEFDLMTLSVDSICLRTSKSLSVGEFDNRLLFYIFHWVLIQFSTHLSGFSIYICYLLLTYKIRRV